MFFPTREKKKKKKKKKKNTLDLLLTCIYIRRVRKDAFEFAKEKYFNGNPDARTVQKNFNLITSFIQDSADKHIPSKTTVLFTVFSTWIL